jgi:Eukaryotic DNA topoisomerase I, catalytic core
MTIKTFSVLARVNPKSLDAFIQLLYSASAVVATDIVDKKLSQDAITFAKDAKEVDKELGTDIVPMLLKITKSNDYDEDELTEKVREVRRSIRKEITTDVKVGHASLDMLKSLTAYLSSRSEAALRKLINLAPLTKSRDIISALTFKASSQKEFIKPLEKIVQAVSKRKGAILSAEEQKSLKDKSPKLHKEYLRLRKEFNNVWKDELRTLVNQSGKELSDYKYALDYLASQSIENPLPKNFVGNIDANGKLYTKAGKLISGVPGVGFKVVMNPDYDSKKDDSFVFTTLNPEGGISQYVYTVAYRKQATQEKFQKVDALDKVIDGIRNKWMAYVRKGGSTPQAVGSTLLELLYQFSARIGSMGNVAGGQATYGMSTLQARHLKVSPTGIIFSYPGKDGVKQTHVLQGSAPETTWLIRNVKSYLKDKEPKDRVFTFDLNNKVYPMTGNLVNRWFEKLGSPVTVHKLRHVRGSKLFAQLLEENAGKLFNRKKPLTQAQADAAFKQLASKVGAMLGHVRGIGKQQKITPMTACQNYISPSLMLGFYDKLGLRPPKFLSKFID